MALITYADKQAMGTQPSIPEVNKITDSNMNEIKTVVNANANTLEESIMYSTTEKEVGTWEKKDGTIKPLYRRAKYFVTTTQVQSTWTPIFSISDIEDVIAGRMGVSADSGDTDYPWSAVWYDNLFRYNNGNVEYFGDRAHKVNYIVVEYTKTTD